MSGRATVVRCDKQALAVQQQTLSACSDSVTVFGQDAQGDPVALQTEAGRLKTVAQVSGAVEVLGNIALSPADIKQLTDAQQKSTAELVAEIKNLGVIVISLCEEMVRLRTG